MEKLWAPWRMAYIEVPAPTDCIFCEKPASGQDERHWILHRNEHAFIILNAFPYNNGHLMVAPFRHTADFSSLDAAEKQAIFDLTQLCVSLLDSAYQPD